MNAEHKPLPSRKASVGTGFREPSTYARVSATSPAISVMTDLRQVTVATIRPGATLNEATQTMISRGVRLLLVVEPGDQVIGLITARDTQGERPIQLIHERGGRYDDLQVRDLMISLENIDLIDIKDVLRAEVGDIVATLKAWGRQHALVGETDTETGAPLIRGIFSATQIGRQLGLPVQTFEVARTFADIQAALAKEY
jgi:hypothetical protein